MHKNLIFYQERLKFLFIGYEFIPIKITVYTAN